MFRRAIIFFCAGVLSVGCKRDAEEQQQDAKPADDDKQQAEAPVEPSLQVDPGDGVDPGPVPPEASMVFFVAEGGLVPLGCFDQKAGTLKAGAACLKLVPEGAEVRLGSSTATGVKTVGGRTEPLCMAGSGKKNALAVEDLGSGATFHFAAWPRSTYKAIAVVDEGTLEQASLNEAQTEALRASIGKSAANAEIEAHQVVDLALAGDEKSDRIYSVFVPDPGGRERYRFSGMFLDRGADLEDLVTIARSKSRKDVFEVRGTVDLDGDGSKELWTRMVFAEGAGDNLIAVENGRARPLGKWSCGVM